MALDSNQIDSLKNILENSLHPQHLDTHPWTKSLIVFASSQGRTGTVPDAPGRELVAALEKIFSQMMPRTAPRRGKRLDTRWGEFGILAALYFAPLVNGSPAPASLRDAWGLIDQSILYFVYGKPVDSLTPEEKAKYKLVGDEPDVASHSTLSDWRRKGLQRLLDMVVARESYLSKTLGKPALILPIGGKIVQEENLSQNASGKIGKHKLRRLVFLLVGVLFLGLILITGFKALRIYNLSLLVRDDVAEARALNKSAISDIEKAKRAGFVLSNLQRDFSELKIETEPLYWIGPWLGWVPSYGGELASIQDLAVMGDSLLASANISYDAIFPVIEEYSASGITPPRLIGILKQAQPKFALAKQDLEIAIAARSHLESGHFSPQVRNLIENNIDPLITIMQDGLTLGTELPRLLGATGEGPKTYLLLVQNEDELRPTGGFITAAGTLLIQEGQISELTFNSTGKLDNWSKLYPASPWQLNRYMNSPVLILRDSNWFTNYPTAALYAEYLYSYTNSHSVDGVIAFDQHALVEILRITGPIDVEDVPYPVDANNVIAYMRAAKTLTAEELASPDWDRKAFINKITRVLMTKIFAGDISWEKLVTLLQKVLNERHLLLQLDSPSMANLLAEHHWDGAVRSETGDYLMVVDSNIGFNKTNAVVESSLFYDVDLTDLSKPVGTLDVVHKNKAKGILVCKQWDKIRLKGEENYPITDCYWNYLRVYTAKGAQLVDSTPQYIPAGWMINNQSVPARVDALLDEGIDNVQAFGSLQVVPIGESLSADFRFALPTGVITTEPNSGRSVYYLKVQKQPGTLAVPLTVRVHLPNDLVAHVVSPKAVIHGNNILFETKLLTDVEIKIEFGAP